MPAMWGQCCEGFVVQVNACKELPWSLYRQLRAGCMLAAWHNRQPTLPRRKATTSALAVSHAFSPLQTDRRRLNMIYGANVWDPVLIIAQILSLQCLFYLSLGFWQALFLGRYLQRLTTLQLLSWQAFSFSTTAGWLTILSNGINALFGAVCLMWLVERAKKCLDFASTCYFIHFIVVWCSQGFPVSFSWWLTMCIYLLIMALAGEWLCVRRELQDIPLTSLRGRGAAASSLGSSTAGGPASIGTTAATSGAAAAASSELQPLLATPSVGASTSSNAADRAKTLIKTPAVRPGPENV